MGNSESTTVVNQLTQDITNIAISSTLDCLVTTNQTQSTTVVNNGFLFSGNYNVAQTTDVSSTCFQDSQKEATLQNNIIAAIAQTSTAEGQSIMSGFGSTSSSATTNLTTIIRSNVTMSTIQKNYNLIRQNQSATIINNGTVIFQNLDLTQGAQVFAASTLQAVDNAGVLNTVKTTVDQTAAATSPSLFSFSLSSYYTYIYLFLFIVAVYYGYTFYKSKYPTMPDDDGSALAVQDVSMPT